MIREIKEDEYKECADVIRKSFMTVADEFGFTIENAPRFTAFAVTEESIRDRWVNEQHRPMFGYFDGEKLVGYYNLFIEDKKCDLGSLSVLPEYRHNGIGAELLEDACKRAKEFGCEYMALSIVEENRVLRKWYEKFGFVHQGTQKFDFFPFTCGYLAKYV